MDPSLYFCELLIMCAAVDFRIMHCVTREKSKDGSV